MPQLEYRYAWLRDAGFALYAFITTGHLDAVEVWRDWPIRTCSTGGRGARSAVPLIPTLDAAARAEQVPRR